MKDFLFIVLSVSAATLFMVGLLWALSITMAMGGPLVTIALFILALSALIFVITR